MPHHFVALDLGAESGRAIVGTLAGGRVRLAEKHRFANPTGRINGHWHWSLLAQWEEIKTGLRRCAGPKLEGIGVDTWGVDFALIGRDGQVLGDPFHYRDSRTDTMMPKAFARVSRSRIFAATGIQLMQFNTLYQLLSMRLSSSLPAARTLLFMPDLFHYLLTGKRTCEFSIASTSQMYDMRKHRWATGLLKELGLPTKILPKVVPSGTVIGPLRADVAQECGLGAVPVIAPGCHDTASAVAAVPAQGNDWCYISSGTWSLMGVELDEPIIDERSLRYNYTNEGGVGGKIRFLKNIMGLWLVQECRRHWAREGREYDYERLTRMARAARGHQAFVDPGYAPFLAPGHMPAKIAEFCRRTKQKPPRGEAQTVRVCLDSLALTYRRTLEGLQEMLGRRIGVIHIVGGGCRNELLNQMTADATGCTVIAGPVEATAMGNILVQAMAVGRIRSLAHVRQVVRDSAQVKRFEPRDTRSWDKAYERFQEIATDT